VLNRQGGQMRVTNEISGRLTLFKELSQNLPMSLCRLHYPRARLIKPTLDAIGSL